MHPESALWPPNPQVWWSKRPIYLDQTATTPSRGRPYPVPSISDTRGGLDLLGILRQRRSEDNPVCVDCLYLRSPSRAPCRTPPACAQRAAYRTPPPYSPTQNPSTPRRPTDAGTALLPRSAPARIVSRHWSRYHRPKLSKLINSQCCLNSLNQYRPVMKRTTFSHMCTNPKKTLSHPLRQTEPYLPSSL